MQRRAANPIVRLIRAVLHALGVPLTDPQVEEVALRLYRPVLRARDQTYLATVKYLRDVDLPDDLMVPLPREFPIEALTGEIKRIVHDIRLEGDPVTAATRENTRVVEVVREAVEGPILRQVKQPARETVAAIGEDEEQPRVGWARVLVGAESCGFCAMLASRGPVYNSEDSATGRGGSSLKVYHTPYIDKRGNKVGGFCDCEAIPVIKGQPWEGAAARRELNQLWEDHRADLNEKGRRDPKNAFRRAWDRKVREGATQQFLVESVQRRAA